MTALVARPGHTARAARPARASSRTGVPWPTVLTLAAVMSFADGFWLVSERGAVGAIETTQRPFSAWWHEAIVAVPLFTLAVLAACMLSRRLVRRSSGLPATAATVLLVSVAGTIAGVAQIVATAAYDYHLQVLHLAQMNGLHGLCDTDCLAQQQHDTLAVHVRAVLYTGRWILLTNVVLVVWLTALFGGRLAAARRARVDERTAGAERDRDLRLVVVTTLVGSAAVHLAVIREHLSEWPAAGAFFAALTIGQLALAGVVATRIRLRAALLVTAIASVATVVLWIYSRTVGLPFGPDPGTPEAVGIPDIVASVLEVLTFAAAAVLLWAPRRVHRPALSAHARALVVTAIVTATALGLAVAGTLGVDLTAGSSHHSHSATSR